MIQNDTIAPTTMTMCGLQAAKYNQAAADIVLYDNQSVVHELLLLSRMTIKGLYIGASVV